jgi:DNA invertase Pin-like site-specific DNA recombinase
MKLASATVSVPSLADWLRVGPGQHKVPRQRRDQPAQGNLRFAFYGRMSTSEYQYSATSRAWQLNSATSVTAGHGAIVAEYFDTACSRRTSWNERPQASALLRAAAAPDRAFDAVVIGEFERGFHGGQLPEIAAALAAHGVELWMPETRGPVDLDSPTHQALMLLLGHQSSREVLRARFRTMTAMRAQARDQGRHLGGRPPYGYRLVDAGAHPNAAHARWGRQLQRLDIDPVTAPHVRWIFAQRLTGKSAAAIARELNDRHIPSPSGHDPGRNPHRHDRTWTLRTVAEILANPRYTGRQVWNRHRTDHRETIPGDKRTGVPLRNQLNARDQWVVSRRQTHPALVSEQDFITVQAITPHPSRTPPRPAATHRAPALRHLRPHPRRPLGLPQTRLPLPTRTHQHPRRRTRPTQEHLRPARHRDRVRHQPSRQPGRGTREDRRQTPSDHHDHHLHTHRDDLGTSQFTQKRESFWWGLTCPRGDLNPHALAGTSTSS